MFRKKLIAFAMVTILSTGFLSTPVLAAESRVKFHRIEENGDETEYIMHITGSAEFSNDRIIIDGSERRVNYVPEGTQIWFEYPKNYIDDSSPWVEYANMISLGQGAFVWFDEEGYVVDENTYTTAGEVTLFPDKSSKNSAGYYERTHTVTIEDDVILRVHGDDDRLTGGYTMYIYTSIENKDNLKLADTSSHIKQQISYFDSSQLVRMVENGTTYVPLRGFMSSISGSMSFDPETKKIKLFSGNQTFIINLNNVLLKNGEAYIALDPLSTILEVEFVWDEKTSTVTVYDLNYTTKNEWGDDAF